MSRRNLSFELCPSQRSPLVLNLDLGVRGGTRRSLSRTQCYRRCAAPFHKRNATPMVAIVMPPLSPLHCAHAGHATSLTFASSLVARISAPI